MRAPRLESMRLTDRLEPELSIPLDGTFPLIDVENRVHAFSDHGVQPKHPDV
jgi:hypothetical protein